MVTFQHNVSLEHIIARKNKNVAMDTFLDPSTITDEPITTRASTIAATTTEYFATSESGD